MSKAIIARLKSASQNQPLGLNTPQNPDPLRRPFESKLFLYESFETTQEISGILTRKSAGRLGRSIDPFCRGFSSVPDLAAHS